MNQNFTLTSGFKYTKNNIDLKKFESEIMDLKSIGKIDLIEADDDLRHLLREITKKHRESDFLSILTHNFRFLYIWYQGRGHLAFSLRSGEPHRITDFKECDWSETKLEYYLLKPKILFDDIWS